ncbi:cytochrome P450 [Streptomyces poonensis]|uniref:Cytochrome P450 n=1 Tax=Streptomyces poonensis TaxID=68255 RepID=A0A918QBD0_9ACTN|nr:cytochrome P450 [Streptomyces poonensis]GGZ39830.1 cytochrome P450 [Streptomyces poonensis]GLJ92899.1 cytochrome P450 [Streptomyces poonensis]
MPAPRTEDALHRFPFPRVPATRPPCAYARFRADEPVVRVAMPSGDTAYFVTRYEDARFVLTDPRFSRAVELAGLKLGDIGIAEHLLLSNLANMDRPEHTRLRRLVSSAFSESHVARLRPEIEKATRTHLDRLARREPPVDLMEELCRHLPAGVLLDYLGIPYTDRDRLLGWTGVLTDLAGHTQEEVDATRDALHAHLKSVIAARRQDPGDDVLTLLSRLCYEERRISEFELEALAMFLLIGGLHTVVYQLGLCVVALLENPDQIRHLLTGPEAGDAALEELLRYTNAVESSLLRTAREDVTVGGCRIPAGSAVLAAIPSANHDERCFPSPDELDLRRRPDPAHLTFGHGMHRCLGAPISRLMLRIVLPALFRRFPTLRLAVPPSALAWKPDRLLTGYDTIPVTWSGTRAP